MKNRMNPCRLNIGAYILQPYARAERHIREIAECGLNFIVCMVYDIPALDLFHKYGVGAVVNGVVPGWWHDNVWDANGDKTGRYEKLRIVNGEISCMGGPYMEHQNSSTHLIGFKDRSPEQFSKITEATVDCLDAGMFGGVRAEHGERVVAGHMTRVI